MKRLLLSSIVFTTIVAAFHVQVAAADIVWASDVSASGVSEDVPVAGGTLAIAQAVGLAAPPDRARFVADVARVLYGGSDSRRASADGLVRTLPAAPSTPPDRGTDAADAAAPPLDVVPVPLTTEIWNAAVFHRRVSASGLVTAILADRRAALLCHGLAALDDSTLAFLSDHPDVITRLYTEHAAVFAVFAGALHVRDGRVATVGGDAAAPLWEAAVGEPVTRPDRFVRELFTRGGGRLAYLYDAIGQLDRAHAAFALGAWMPAPRRAERFAALVSATNAAYREWHVDNVPFARPIHDIASLLMRVDVAADGSPKPPAGRTLWSAVFAGGDLADADAKLRAPFSDEPVDAAWLAQSIARLEAQQRGDRLDQFSFGQRTFGSAADDDRAATILALRAFDRYPMLMLTLERIGVTRPSAYVAAGRHAGELAAVNRRRGFAALAQFQGVVAVIARFVRVHTLDTDAAESLIESLCGLPVGVDGYDGAVLQWIEREIRPRLPEGEAVDRGLLAQLAGVRGTRSSPPVHIVWEGQSYHLDLAAAEERRLRLVRERQRGVPLDSALDIEDQARRLRTAPLDAAVMASAIDALSRDLAFLRSRPKSDEEIAPEGVKASRDPRVVLAAAIESLGKMQKSPAPGRAAQEVRSSLTTVAEEIAADALLSLAYAVDLGDPDGTVLMAGNVARRHDFGFALNDAAARARVAWSAPNPEVTPGAPWRVSGSALGLDVGLASLVLRRVDASRVGGAPSLTSNERQTFAVSVALMRPAELTDVDRDTIAAATARGAERIAALTPESLDGIAAEIALDGWRRRAVKWSIAHDAARVATMFSLTELLSLGGGFTAGSLDAWGMSAVPTDGCVCTRLRAPGGWWNLAGRPQVGLLATTVADVNLRVAVLLHDLNLPAALARDVLTAAVQDYIDDVRPSDHDDWLTLVRAAQAISRDRVEDYVAAITSGGALVPDEKGDGSLFGGAASPTLSIDTSAVAGKKRGRVSR